MAGLLANEHGAQTAPEEIEAVSQRIRHQMGGPYGTSDRMIPRGSARDEIPRVLARSFPETSRGRLKP
jgi:hypothetical protein